MAEWNKYAAYRNAGGELGYDDWVEAGMPASPPGWMDRVGDWGREQARLFNWWYMGGQYDPETAQVTDVTRANMPGALTERSKTILATGQPAPRPAPSPETPTEETPFKPDPIPGKIWVPTYNAAGEVTSWETKPDPGWMSPAQEAQLKMQKWQMMWDEEKTRQNLLAGRWNAMAERIGAMSRPDLERVRQEERAKVWDTVKAEIMGGLQEPRDWIKRWELQNTQNPYAIEETPYDMMKQAEEDVKKYSAAAKTIQKRMADPTDPLFQNVDRPDAPTTPEQTRANFVLTALKNAEDRLVHYSAKQAEERAEYEKTLGPGQFTPPSPEPTTPPTPAWLANIYPDMPSRIEKREGMPLSAQAARRMTPSELEGWKGYAEWAGYSPEDLLTQTAQMIPLGGRSTRWQPPGQRAI